MVTIVRLRCKASSECCTSGRGQPCGGPPVRRQRQHLSPPGPRNEQYKCAICRPRRALPSPAELDTLCNTPPRTGRCVVSPGRQGSAAGPLWGSSLDSRERDASPCEPLTESWECSRADNAQQLVLYDTIVMRHTSACFESVPNFITLLQ